jgi:hypothetical protein
MAKFSTVVRDSVLIVTDVVTVAPVVVLGK